MIAPSPSPPAATLFSAALSCACACGAAQNANIGNDTPSAIFLFMAFSPRSFSAQG